MPASSERLIASVSTEHIPPTERVALLDNAKAVLIILVVLYHTLVVCVHRHASV